MFDRDNAITVFRRFVGDDPASLPVAAAFAAMCDFYAEVPPDGAVPEDEDGDMLLFEYGTYDWGQGAAFEIALTRQITWEPEEDEIEIWQLRIVACFDPAVMGDGAYQGTHWLGSRDDLPEFRAMVLEAPVLQTAGSTSPASMTLTWGRQ